MRRVSRCMHVRLHLAVAGEYGGLSRQGAGQRKDLRRMPALRRGLRMGRNLHHAVRPEGGVPELARSRASRGERRLIFFSVSTRAAIVLAVAVAVLAAIQTTPAAGL